jgi:hypothetical protein
MKKILVEKIVGKMICGFITDEEKRIECNKGGYTDITIDAMMKLTVSELETIAKLMGI